MKPDRTFTLSVMAVVLVLCSYFVPAMSVHTYCENRLFVGIIASGDLVVLYFLLRNSATSRIKRVLSSLSVVFCLLGAFIDVAFVVWATKECREMMENLNRMPPVRYPF